MPRYSLKAVCVHCGRFGTIDDVSLICADCGEPHTITDEQRRQRDADMALQQERRTYSDTCPCRSCQHTRAMREWKP